jgi:hypothetical protein
MTTEDQVVKYINDPNTRVYINYNDETGEWLYSVVVDNSEAFWLDSFETENAAIPTDKELEYKIKYENDEYEGALAIKISWVNAEEPEEEEPEEEEPEEE